MLKAIRELKAQGRLSELNRLVPYSAVVGFDCIVDEKGGVITVLGQRDSNIGNTTIPAVHGGVVASLLEHAAIMQLLWETEIETLPRIINVSVDYLRPCLGDRDTFARGRLVKQGRRVANVRVEAWQDDPDKPVAAAHAHFLVD